MRGGLRRGYPDPMRLRLAPVLLDPRMRVKAPGNRRRAVQLAQRRRHAPNGLRPAHLLERDRAAVDESGHEPTIAGEKSDDRRSQAHLRGPPAPLALDRAVAPAQAGLG